jgi:hypothetical protein
MSPADALRRFVQRLTGRGNSPEEERLIALFRNRAELKKELLVLDDERHRLQDRLKLQEGATMRAEEQLEALEQCLGRPEEGYKCLAYFQLRAVWHAAARRLARFSEALTREREQLERQRQLADFERGKRARVADVDRELLEARVLADQLRAEQRLVAQRLATLGGFWNYFRRRQLVDQLGVRRQRVNAAQAQVAELERRRVEADSAPPPLFEGLSVEGRRIVNLEVIACAEALLEQLNRSGLADLVRESMLRRVYDTSYGGREECLALMQRASRAIGELEHLQDDRADVQARAGRLQRSVGYRDEAGTVPLQETLQASAPLLLDEYWDIYKVLLP